MLCKHCKREIVKQKTGWYHVEQLHYSRCREWSELNDLAIAEPDDFEVQLSVEDRMYDKDGLETFKDRAYPKHVDIVYSPPYNADFEVVVGRRISELGYKRDSYQLTPQGDIVLGFIRGVSVE
jgi:hypothetical protein